METPGEKCVTRIKELMANEKSQNIDNTRSSASDDYGQYHVDGPLQMCSILKDLSKKPEVITAFYDDAMKEFILTSVIHVDTKKKNFIIFSQN